METFKNIGIILAIVFPFIVLSVVMLRALGRRKEAYEKIESMEAYKYKTKFDDKLIELGVKDRWAFNLSQQCEKDDVEVSWRLAWVEKQKTFHLFLAGSFQWDRSLEGFNFWYKLADE